LDSLARSGVGQAKAQRAVPAQTCLHAMAGTLRFARPTPPLVRSKSRTSAVNLKFLSFRRESSWEFQIQKPH
jgi:hypothetical protein